MELVRSENLEAKICWSFG